jgi:translation initiation factor 4G
LQVFDKALSEPSFSEIYATLCYDLNHSLPTFTGEDEEGGTQEITFRRLLLNKCQEEFEEGDVAMKAVEAREKAEQQKAEVSMFLHNSFCPGCACAPAICYLTSAGLRLQLAGLCRWHPPLVLA